jgi:hypothetical protein
MQTGPYARFAEAVANSLAVAGAMEIAAARRVVYPLRELRR